VTDTLSMSTSLCLRITVLTIIFAMLVPAVLIGDLGPVKVRAASNVPAPVSAPAEPFLVQGSEFKVQSLLAFGVHSLLSYALADTRASALEPQSVSQNSQLSTLNSPLLTPPPPGSVRFDFDGDGKADIGRWHATTTEFKVKNSFNGTFTTSMIGTTAARSCPADFDGDGKTDQAVFYTGTWKIRKSSNGTIQTITGFGQAGDIPLPGNYRGSTAIDAAVFRPSNNTWYFRDGATGALTSQVWGAAGDIPVPGNYNGDALTDVAVYRPATGVWYIVLNGGGNLTYTWGTGSDIPVPADYDADNKTDVAVYRRTSGTWYVIGSHPTTGMFSQVWGNYGDQPTPADYDGDGKADFSIWRPTTGKWYTINSLHSTNQQYPQFSYDTLGVAGDTAVPSSYIKQIGGTVSPSQLASERLSPKNATGGTDLYSRNFAWGTSLAGLPGRAGMNAGFGIGYNSLVWTKSGSEIYFDTDAGNVSPGFRIGFPTIEPAYYDSVKGAFAYLMVTPSGGRVEFRQIAATGYYETVDSSYARLLTSGAANPNDPVENITITVTSTDGTQMKYLWKGGAFRCMEIKDRNGNYITLVYDDYGLLQTMTDTLGRIVTVVYDTSLYPVTVKQSWQNGDHNYATLAYTNVSINTNFTTPITSVIGPPNGTVIKALEKITYADLSYTKFTYNSYGQVWKVQNFAADNHELNYVKTNLETPGTSNSDCPRLGQSVSWVENFDARFDRSYEYDFSSRMTKALTGAEARGSTDSANNIPYHNTYSYDAFSHRTAVVAANFTGGNSFSLTYANNRINGGSYDFDGNQFSNPTDAKTFSYNAAGQMSNTYMYLSAGGSNYQQQTEDVTYDGDGNIGKIVTADWHNEDTPIPDTTYKVRSTLLGGQLVYEGSTAIVYAGGTRIWAGGYWTHQDANGHTIRSTFSDGSVQGDGSLPDAFWDKKELDPDGKQTGFSAPVYYPLEDNDLFAPMSNFGVMSHGQYTTYKMDGINVPADYVAMRINSASIGGAIGLLFLSAQMSAPRFSHYSVNSRFGLENFGSGREAFTQAWGWASETHGTFIRNFAVNDSWALNWSLIPQTDASVPDDDCKPGQPCPKAKPQEAAGKKSPCADMAAAYQGKRDEWVTNWESKGNKWTVAEYDKSITPMFLSNVVDGSIESNRFFVQTGGGLGPKAGQQDFKDKYIDDDFERMSDSPDADQVHHFAAYFSAGMNGAYFSSVAHGSTDGATYRSATIYLPHHKM
jgi:YD repeat-containing protein